MIIGKFQLRTVQKREASQSLSAACSDLVSCCWMHILHGRINGGHDLHPDSGRFPPLGSVPITGKTVAFLGTHASHDVPDRFCEFREFRLEPLALGADHARRLIHLAACNRSLLGRLLNLGDVASDLGGMGRCRLDILRDFRGCRSLLLNG